MNLFRCNRWTQACLLPVLLLLASACASAGGKAEPWVEVGGERFTVEIADDDAERARGLMFRDKLAPGTGMLFIHESQGPLSYWMMNTRIPLDILYFDADRRLVSQSRATPPCPPGQPCPAYPSRAPARYVLELNAGEAARLGLELGDEMHFSPGLSAGN